MTGQTKILNWTIICSGCGECCGPVPFTEKFLLENAHLYQEQPLYLDDCFEGLFVPITKSLSCVFLDKVTKRCLVYGNRPEVCRLQGTIPQLPCSHIQEPAKFMMPSGVPRSDKDE